MFLERGKIPVQRAPGQSKTVHEVFECEAPIAAEKIQEGEGSLLFRLVHSYSVRFVVKVKLVKIALFCIKNAAARA